MKANKVEPTILGILAFLSGLQMAALFVLNFVYLVQGGAEALSSFISVFSQMLHGFVLMAFGVVVLFTGKRERPVATACLAAISAAWSFTMLYMMLKDLPGIGMDLIALQFQSYQAGAYFITVILGLALGIWGCLHAGGYLKRMRAAYEAVEEEPCKAGEVKN